VSERDFFDPDDVPRPEADAPAAAEPRPDAAATAAGALGPPAGRAARGRMALCLSGGGYRAALFHLGAVRRLDELGLLGHVDAVSAVSGGSLLAAHLALCAGGLAAEATGDAATGTPATEGNAEPAGDAEPTARGARGRTRWAPTGQPVFPDFERQVAAPFRAFTRRNVRTPAILRRSLPWNWLADDTGVRGLEAAYDRHLTAGRRLGDLPVYPRFVFCATDMVFGTSWVFERQRAGGYLPGYTREARDWPLARAVAASSCFPPVFSPLRLGLAADSLRGGRAPAEAVDDRERAEIARLIPKIGLSDGGVYDNLGLEPVWESTATLLVSDGGATFPWASPRNPFRWLLRYAGVASNQVQALRTRWMAARAAQGQGDRRWAMWRIRHARDDGQGYPASLSRGTIAEIRTDLDAFSDAEAAVLENHGYLVADAALEARLADDPRRRPAPLAVPHPDWLDPARAAAALERSDRRRVLGRWRRSGPAPAPGSGAPP
jgi:NTE family protein